MAAISVARYNKKYNPRRPSGFLEPTDAHGVGGRADSETKAIIADPVILDVMPPRANEPLTAHDYKRRLDDIDWTRFQTAYGRADNVPAELLRLASLDHATAINATHKLWCCLCHQHAYISSAALPALPFILDVLDSANDELTVEILDILTGFAICSTLGPKGTSPNEWERNLRDKLRFELPRFAVLMDHDNEEIAGFAERIVENLNKYVA